MIPFVLSFDILVHLQKGLVQNLSKLNHVLLSRSQDFSGFLKSFCFIPSTFFMSQLSPSISFMVRKNRPVENHMVGLRLQGRCCIKLLASVSLKTDFIGRCLTPLWRLRVGSYNNTHGSYKCHNMFGETLPT